ncbi:LysR family transcriptional regulator ArgP [Antribacter sp. KLBMP9083]|uniref:LysR family transcriptional regulator ArgP n=1 Tax=Antribacter soli TaxID=2910976 RepID=A0AA41U7W3_9MICO|nr:LysR family transcriptional regulator ArgP [Antribacter soli]MCF4119822.1 LysR family transcriptional regulator ArgP [Antribacter soli]
MRWDSAQLEALAAVVAEGSFDAAARALHITPSAMSQRIRALENTAGSVLVKRTRPVEPTATGQTLLRLARQVELLGAEASAELGAAGDAGGAWTTVPIAVNADSLATWFLPALARVDGVCFDLHRADQDRTAELLPRGVVMMAVTSQAEPVQGCSSVPLGAMTYRPVATPAFARRWFPDGPTTAALSVAPVVVFDRADDLQDRYLRSRGASGPPRHHVPSSIEYVEAVRLGLGWGMLPELQSAPSGLPPGRGVPGRRHASGPLVDDDDLVPVDPDAVVDVALHLQQWKLRSAVLDQVAAALRAEAARSLRPLARG